MKLPTRFAVLSNDYHHGVLYNKICSESITIFAIIFHFVFHLHIISTCIVRTSMRERESGREKESSITSVSSCIHLYVVDAAAAAAMLKMMNVHVVHTQRSLYMVFIRVCVCMHGVYVYVCCCVSFVWLLRCTNDFMRVKLTIKYNIFIHIFVKATTTATHNDNSNVLNNNTQSKHNKFP